MVGAILPLLLLPIEKCFEFDDYYILLGVLLALFNVCATTTECFIFSYEYSVPFSKADRILEVKDSNCFTDLLPLFREFVLSVLA